MSEYYRSLGIYMAMLVMFFVLAGFILYYSNVTSLKQDTYKEFMYSSMNKSTLRMIGAEELANGNISAYYADGTGSYTQLDDEIVKQLGMSSKINGKVDYEVVYNIATNEYYLHVQTSNVDSVIKFKLEDGRD